MALIRWNPFFFDDAFADFFEEGKTMAPAIDVYEKGDKIVAESPLPGIDPKNVKVEVEDGVLVIKGEESKKSEVEEKNYYRKEVRHGSFYRSVRLPAAVKEDKAEANFKNGILTVLMPKAGEPPKKSVTIKVEEK
jgi:HSP20 family protein